jgi:MATE family multidrug resistance protein
MTRKNDLRRSLLIAGPVIIGQLSYIALGVIDSMMVGRLGATPLAAAALANSYLAIPLTFCFGLAAGIAPIVAKLGAQKKNSALRRVLRNGTWTTLTIGLLCGLLMLLCIPLLHILGQPEPVVAEAKPYIYLLALSLLPQALFLNFKNFTEGLEWMRPALYVGVISVPINFILNYFLIFGPGIFPEWGLVGAGVATVITRVIMLVSMYYYMLNSKFEKYVEHKRSWDLETIRKILKIGVPAGTQYVLETGAFVAAALLMGMIGTLPLAAHQIAINLASIPFMVCIGLSSAGAIRMGRAYGENDISRIRFSGGNILWLTVGFMTLTAIIFALLRFELPKLYIKDPAVILMAGNMLLIAAIFQISDGIQAVCVGLLRGLEDVRWPTFFALMAYWVFGLPLGYFLTFTLDWGYIGIWYGLLIGLSLSALFLLLRFVRSTRNLSATHSN